MERSSRRTRRRPLRSCGWCRIQPSHLRACSLRGGRAHSGRRNSRPICCARPHRRAAPRRVRTRSRDWELPWGPAYHDGDEGWDRVGDAVHRFPRLDDVGVSKVAAPGSSRLASRRPSGPRSRFTGGCRRRGRRALRVRRCALAGALGSIASFPSPRRQARRRRDQRMGTIDLLLGVPGRLVVIDHKTFPAPPNPPGARLPRHTRPPARAVCQGTAAVRGDLPLSAGSPCRSTRDGRLDVRP